MKERIAILDGIRTPFVKSDGIFKHLDADDLGAIVVKEILARTGLGVNEIDEVIFGNVAQPIHASNVSRVIALKAGLPFSSIAHTVNRNCASGMQSITAGALQIVSGESEIIIAGGTESMSNIPLVFRPQMKDFFFSMLKAKSKIDKLKVLFSFRLRYLNPIIGVEKGLTDPICGMIMGLTAEVLSREFKITRKEQDEFALLSHKRAVAAIKAGRLAEEIIPVPVPPDYSSIQMVDDSPRESQTMEALQKLKPYFDRKTGTITVGNSCPLSDGAAAVVLCSEQKAIELGIKPIGYLKAFAYAGLEGSRMGLGPYYATEILMKKTGLTMKDFD
ncbi:MAG: thiolase family protein, partial [Candidatus Margulisiibacteriota bacterium]